MVFEGGFLLLSPGFTLGLWSHTSRYTSKEVRFSDITTIFRGVLWCLKEGFYLPLGDAPFVVDSMPEGT